RTLLAAHLGPDTYATIQAAVDAAAPGAIITVDAGVYAEKVVISKPMSLRGAQAGVDARSSARGGNESIVRGTDTSDGRSTSFYIAANDVTLDGFTVQDNSGFNSDGAGIVIAPLMSGTHVFN